MSKLSDRANLDKTKYKPLSNARMSTKEKGEAEQRIANELLPKSKGDGIMYRMKNEIGTESLVSDSLQRSDANTIPTKASTTPRNKGQGTGGPSVG